MAKASATSAGVARGTVPTSRLSQGKRTSRRRAVSTFLPAMRSCSCRTSLRTIVSMSGHQIESEVEGVEVAPVPAVCRLGELAIADQRHVLLGDAAMAAQRLGQAGQVVLCSRRAEHLVLGRDDDDV